MDPEKAASFTRACEACRMHKVRCLPNTSATSPSTACQRCARTDRRCIFTAPQKRKQRKRTDTRVAELEREVQAMRALFDKKAPHHSSGTGPRSSDPPPSEGKQHSQSPEVPDPQQYDISGVQSRLPVPESFTPKSPEDSPSPRPDVIDRGIISTEMATQLLKTYMNDLYEHYPAIPISLEVPAEEIRRSQPTLFLAAIAAAAGKTDPSLYSVLNSEVLQVYAQRTLVHGEKTLELVKAMVISVIWYYPPGGFARLKFYEYIHMAASMAMDLGIGKNPRPARNRHRADSIKSSPESDCSSLNAEEEMDRRRTFVVCFVITTGVSMSMRRPNMLRSTNWLKESIDYVAANANPAYKDNLLVGWANLLLITEEIFNFLSFDDPDEVPSLSETRTQRTLVGFEKKLLAWREQHESTGSVNDALMMTYHHTQLFLHEICLHDDHPEEDFRGPFVLYKIVSIDVDLHATSDHIDAVAVSIESAQSLLDVLLGMEIQRVRALPMFNFVRMCYALILLVKIYISSKTLESKIGAVLSPKMLRLDHYLESLIQHLGLAVGTMECRAPFTFLGLVMRLQIWYKSQENDAVFRKPTELYNVIDHCYLPAPPNIGKGSAILNEPVRFDPPAPKDTDSSQMDDTQSLAMTDLAMMQPLPGFEYDFGNAEVNSLLNSGGLDLEMTSGYWTGMPDMNFLSMDGSSNANVPGTNDVYQWNAYGTDNGLK